MNPTFLDEMSWEMAEVYGAITDQIVINMARLFPYVKVGGKVPESAFAYQSAMLAQMGQVNKQTIQIIRNNLSEADAALSGVLEATIADAIKKAEPELYKGAKKGMLSPPAVPVLSPNQTRAFQLYYRQAADKLNLVNTVMLESTQDAYRQCISDVVSEYALAEAMNRTQIALDTAAGETITGVSSWNQALRHATDRLKENGIYGFVDHAGHKWAAESYVAMDIRTTVYNTGRAAVWESNESFGNDLYIVSYHNGARPLCYDWQNKVISANNVSRDVVDLDGNAVHVYAQNETTYGEPAGLFGINCKHYPTPFIPGVSAIRGQVQDKETNDREYEESQKQRKLERNLREEKRDLEILKARGEPEDVIKAQRERVRKASDDIQDFCDETGRVRRRNRESVYMKREFPEGYDPTTFPREQQKRFDDYWKNGGTQSTFTFGQLVPNVPLVPNPVVPTPAQNVAPQATTTAAPAAQSTFVPAKTTAEAQKYAERFGRIVNYSGNVSLDTLNEINRELTELTDKYPIDKLRVLKNNGRLKTSNARASGGIIEFKGSVFARRLVPYDPETYWASSKRAIEQIENMFPNGVPASMMQSYNNCKKRLKYRRWSVSSEYGTLTATIPHEFGHVLSDQYFGMINGSSYCTVTAETLDKVKLVRDTFRQAKQTGDIYSISEYASTNADEFFAESFAARWMGETLPNYIVEMLERVLTK